MGFKCSIGVLVILVGKMKKKLLRLSVITFASSILVYIRYRRWEILVKISEFDLGRKKLINLLNRKTKVSTKKTKNV